MPMTSQTPFIAPDSPDSTQDQHVDKWPENSRDPLIFEQTPFSPDDSSHYYDKDQFGFGLTSLPSAEESEATAVESEPVVLDAVLRPLLLTGVQNGAPRLPVEDSDYSKSVASTPKRSSDAKEFDIQEEMSPRKQELNSDYLPSDDFMKPEAKLDPPTPFDLKRSHNEPCEDYFKNYSYSPPEGKRDELEMNKLDLKRSRNEPVEDYFKSQYPTPQRDSPKPQNEKLRVNLPEKETSKEEDEVEGATAATSIESYVQVENGFNPIHSFAASKRREPKEDGLPTWVPFQPATGDISREDRRIGLGGVPTS